MDKLIARSDMLPEHLQAEMKNLGRAMEQKYGTAAHLVGATLSNMGAVLSMLQDELTPENRVAAVDRAREVFSDIARILGAVLHVEPQDAIAIAHAYGDMTRTIEEEMLGADVVLAHAQSEANDVLAKAAQR